jgi:hypothetical protein
MAPTEPCEERESLRLVRETIRSYELSMETADEALLRKAAKVNHKFLMETAHELGIAEGLLEDQTDIVIALEVKLLAETGAKNSFEAKFHTEQNAKLSLEIANRSLRKAVLD